MKIKKEIGFWGSTFGGVTSAFPIISLAQNIFDVSLVFMFAEMIEFYRGIATLLAQHFLFWTDWRPSQNYLDATTLSMLVSLVYIRSSYFAALAFPEEASTEKSDYILGALFLLACAPTTIFLYLYLLTPIIFLLALYKSRNSGKSPIVIFSKFVLTSFLSSAAAVVVFYVLNGMTLASS